MHIYIFYIHIKSILYVCMYMCVYTYIRIIFRVKKDIKSCQYNLCREKSLP